MKNQETLRPLRGDEAARVSALAQRSKAHWGYPPAQMAVFRGELTLSAEAITRQPAFGIERDGALVGFYTLVGHDSEEAEIEHLFVDPPNIGAGLGRRLLCHALEEAQRLGYQRVLVQTDPNAEGFYIACGGRTIRRIPSSIPGRAIPLIQFDLG